MRLTIVVNARANRYDVYIGRGSKWGNPFATRQGPGVTKIVATREIAVQSYREWLPQQPTLMAQLGELRGKVLGCPGCVPDIQPCHGHVLAELADAIGATS